MSLDGEAEQLYPHSWRILSLVDLGDSIIARIRRLHLRPSPTFDGPVKRGSECQVD
jgi:hypothetical protein